MEAEAGQEQISRAMQEGEQKVRAVEEKARSLE
jgi:hypothetical protein